MTIEKSSLFINDDEPSKHLEFLRTVTEPASSSIDGILENICDLVERMEPLETNVSTNAATIEMNKKRHENADLTFAKLCPLIDQIYDTSDNPPGGIHYDCCKADYTGTTGNIGGGMVCLANSFLSLPFLVQPFSVTDQGICASTCGTLPAALQQQADKMVEELKHEANPNIN